MDVDHPILPCGDKIVVEQSHKPGKRHETDAGVAQDAIGRGGKRRAIGLGDDFGRDAGILGPAASARLLITIAISAG
jgi:hypothetical protein